MILSVILNSTENITYGKARTTMAKRIFTAALTGSIHTPSMSPHLPFTPQQLIDEAVRAHEAGAAVAHVHVRDPKTGVPNADQSIYREVAEEVKRRCDVILCFSTGGKLGEPVENRVRVVSNLKPELTSSNTGSLNFALFHIAGGVSEWKYDWEKPYLEGTEDYIFPNTFRTMRQYLEIIYAHGAKPEFEIYDVGMINNLAFLVQKWHRAQTRLPSVCDGDLGRYPSHAGKSRFLGRHGAQADRRFPIFGLCSRPPPNSAVYRVTNSGRACACWVGR